MKFDAHHKVIPGTLNKDEACSYITFLEIERRRHERNIWQARWLCGEWLALKEFWESAILRHQEDIGEIDKLLGQIRGMFK